MDKVSIDMFLFKRHRFIPASSVGRSRNARVGFLSFTLIELLMVISIIGLLVALLAPALKSAKEHANSIKCMSNLRQIGIAVGLYGGDTGFYPENNNSHGSGGYSPESTFSYTLSRYLEKSGANWNSRSPIFECPTVMKTTTNLCCHYTVHPLVGEVRSQWGTGPYWAGPRPYPIANRATELIMMTDGTLLTGMGGMGDEANNIFTVSTFYDQYNSTFANYSLLQGDNEDFPIGWWGSVRYRHNGNAEANVLFLDNHVVPVKNKKILYRNLQIDSLYAQ